MKVLLATLNSKYVHTNIALYYLKNRIKDIADVSLLNLNINDRLSNSLNNLLSHKPDIVCFGVYIWNIEETLKLASDIKKINPQIIISFGGPEVSYNPNEILNKYDCIDSILCLESENNIVQFIQDVKNNNGIISEDSKKYVTEESQGEYLSNKNIQKIYQIPVEISDIPSIADDIVDNYDGRIVYLETSRGCPFRCSYCLSCIDKKVRQFNLEQVKVDLKKILDKNVVQIRFIDRTFNFDKKRALSLWKFLVDNRKDTTFHFEICASLIDDEILEFLKNVPSNIFRFEIGIQSTNKQTLEAINRRYDFEYEKNVISKLAKIGNIHIHTDLIIGLPYETIETFKETFNKVYSLHSNELQLGFLKLLKGTKIYDQKNNFNYICTDYPPYEVLQNEFMSYQDISYFKKFETVFEYLYNSKKFLASIRYIETKFDTYYLMYEYITNYFIENKLIDIKLSYDDIYVHLIKMFNNDEILIQTLTYDYASCFKGTREWMYNKYDLKKEISNHVKENEYFNDLKISEINKKHKFIVLDYNIDTNKKEKAIYRFDK